MFIDAQRIGNSVYVSYKETNGMLRVKKYATTYDFYYDDPDGEYTSIYGTPISKYKTNDYGEWRDAVEQCHRYGMRTWESDVPPVTKVLEREFPTNDTPELRVQMLDIEVDKDPDKPYARVNNPYAPITSVAVYNKWEKVPTVLIVPPPGMSVETARDLLDGKIYQNEDGDIVDDPIDSDTFGELTEEQGFFVVPDEESLLIILVDLMSQADIISGWNSEFFDIPYIIHRIRLVLGHETIFKIACEDGTRENPFEPSDASMVYLRKLNLFPGKPSVRMVEHYGTDEKTYQLHGRIHMDYLALYKKFTYEELHSYKLDFVLEREIGQNKVEYDGTLDALYRKNFRRFAAYNLQDTMGLSALDDKMKFISLANRMAHMAGVTFDKTVKSVEMIETALSRELHHQGKIAPDKPEITDTYPIPGAFVLEPHAGIYHWIVSYDFNSLYPTVLRMLNISPETIVGFVRPDETLADVMSFMRESSKNTGAAAWGRHAGTIEYRKVIERSEDKVAFEIEQATKHDRVHDKRQLPDLDSECIMIPAKELAEIIIANNWTITAFGLVITREVEGIIPYCMTKWYADRSANKAIAKDFFNKMLATEDEEEKKKFKSEYEYYDLLQLNLKIFLNSTYGSLLNVSSRYYDIRMGASTTMSGRISLGTMVDVSYNILETKTIVHKEAA